MSTSTERIGQTLLGIFLVLILASFVVDNAIVNLLVEVGFALVAFYFAYTTYTNRQYPDGPTKTATAVAFGLAGVGQLAVLATNLAVVDLAATALFVGGFVGYVLLNRR